MQTLYRLTTLLLFLALVGLVQPAGAQDPAPGSAESLGSASKSGTASAMVVNGLNPFYSTSGLVSVSIDGLGTPDGPGTIQVDKPAGATVLKAYLFATTVWTGAVLNGDVSLEGNAITWDAFATGASGSPNANAYADVTSIVKPIVDAAAAGIIDLDVIENEDLDGTILAVVFNDPSIGSPQTVVLLFGAQSTTGDSFAIGLADPFDPATQSVLMSLGISFGYQVGSNNIQYSTVVVNGTQITTSAGGQDDCEELNGGNGCLITVGGVGDDPANPPDPNALATGNPTYRYDDELYTLDALIATGATNITVESANPSNNDNMFFAAFNIQGTSAVVGEGILLGPSSDTNPVGTSHTVTATLQDEEGDPIANRDVTFNIVSGPNAGLTDVVATNASGQAEFTWSSTVAGTDVVEASFQDSQQQTLTSNQVTKEWVDESALACAAAVVRIEDFDANQGANDTMEWVSIIHDETEDVSFTGCHIAFILGSTDRSTYTMPLSGVVPPGGQLLVGNAAVPGVDVVIPDNTIHDMRSGIYILTVPMPPGTRPFQVGASVIAGVTYYNEDNWYSQYPAPPVATKNGAMLGTSVLDLSALAEVPDAYALEQNFPNPFNPETTLRFSIPEAGHVNLAVYDVTGRLVRQLVERPMEAGAHQVVWNGQNDAGLPVPSGMYLVQIRADGFTATRPMTLLK